MYVLLLAHILIGLIVKIKIYLIIGPIKMCVNSVYVYLRILIIVLAATVYIFS